MSDNDLLEPSLTRRDFLKCTAFLGGAAAVAGALPWTLEQVQSVWAQEAVGDYPLARPESILYSVCQQCNTQCGIKVKVQQGVAVKIDGNPYNPFNFNPQLVYKTPVAEAATVDASLCPKGQAGLQSTYDPYRLIKVLKRAGPRGANKWQTIPFDQAISEIVNGGKLFAHVPGEENRVVAGLKEIRALTDSKVLADMAAEVKVIQGKKTPEEKKAAVAAFKEKFKDHLDKLIDPEHPDLGPKNNQFSFMWGRLKGGRSDFISRFTRDGMGSINAHGHTTVCQGSLYFTGKAMSEQFDPATGKFSGGDKFYWQADTENSEFIIFVGASPFEGNYGPTNRTLRITEGLATGRLKYAVVDPRLSKLAAKAWKWLPLKPGTEGAMGLALIRWVIENKRYDAKFLACANKAAAAARNEATWCNATWLVKLTDGKPGNFLRASEIGLATKAEVEKDGKKTTVYKVGATEYAFDPLVCLKDGQPVALDPNDAKTAVEGDLLVNTTVGGVAVKSSLQLLWESASSKTLDEWATICDVRPADLVALASEFTSHGKKAAADVHRGASQHTNGFYNVGAWFNLNLLIGNYDWKGGMVKVSTYDYSGGKADGPYNFSKLNPGKLSGFGISIIRHDVKWEDTTLFEGKYPAKRNWWPLASDIYQEQIPSMGDMYPYQIKALFIYMGSPVYSLPAGNTNLDILADPNKIPLVVASDIVVGETSMYADYIFPDLSNLERWEFVGSHPSMTVKCQGVRQPTIAPVTETVKVYGQEMPISLESMLLALAEKLNLPNFGANGFGEGKPLRHQDDFYLRAVANLAFGEKADGSDAVPDADDAEIQIFLEARKHLPKTVFDPERWRAIAGDAHWKKVIYVLNRGGRFQDSSKIYDGDRVANKYGKLINMYQEKTAGVKNAFTGKPLPGIPTYLPAPLSALGEPLADEAEGYEFQLITYREINQTKSRTISNYWLNALLPENFILMNKRDADRLGLKSEDRVRLVSPTNPNGEWDLKNGQKVPVVGKVRVVQGIRPGVVAFCLGYGHFAYGGVDVTIDGQTISGDPRRTKGVHANAVMRVDPYLKNTCLMDCVGGSAVFYDSRVKVIKV